MSYFFDNNNRYQIIYPFTSEKIHVEQNLSAAAHKCYQEIKESNVKTHIFIIHDIDQGNMYYFDIPKNKDNNTNQIDNNINLMNGMKNPNQHTFLQPTRVIPNPNIEMRNDGSKQYYDSVITRLNNVEYELEMIKKTISQNHKQEKDEELSCNIM